jgi:hypothetical protein
MKQWNLLCAQFLKSVLMLIVLLLEYCNLQKILIRVKYIALDYSQIASCAKKNAGDYQQNGTKERLLRGMGENTMTTQRA